MHAGLQKIFIDELQEEYQLQRDIEQCQQFPAYAKAWEVVREKGYRTILSEFQGHLALGNGN